MAFGFTPKHSEQFRIESIEPQHFLAATIEAIKKLDWKFGFVSESGFIAYTDNGLFSSNFEIKLVINEGEATLTSSSLGSEMFDFGKNKKNVIAFIETLDEIKQQLSVEELNQKYEELKPELAPLEEDFLKLPPATAAENFKSFFAFFIPRQGFFVAPILIWINVLIFILMVINGANILDPSPEILLKWGANFRPFTLNDQWWRLITNCFLHIGIMHLLMNMIALVYIAIFLEPIIGKSRFITAYLLTGITASITSIYWHDLTISAGASGAIFGIYGVFLALLCTNTIPKDLRKSLLTSIGLFIAYNLIYGLKGNIDNAAHIGGLIPGFLIGFAFIPSLKRAQEPAIKYITIGFLSLVVLVSTSVVYYDLPNNSITNLAQMQGKIKQESKAPNPTNDPDFDEEAYQKLMVDFHSVESLALNIFPIDTTAVGKQKSLSDIKDIGIYYWKRGIEILDDLNRQDLPKSFVSRNKVLKQYCEKNLKTYELMYKAIDEGTHEYDNEINAQIKETNELINTIKGN